ncbi:MAG: hypothetical protein ACXW5U_06805 [Thermoanaerobaculia bacterium]
MRFRAASVMCLLLLSTTSGPLLEAGKQRALNRSLRPLPPSPPTSFGLIDDALAKGAIDRETALVYKVFSTFGDERLPAQYRGTDEDPWHSTILTEVLEEWDTLSPATQEALAPFLIPPMYAESWHGRRHGSATSLTSRPPAAASPKPAKCTLSIVEWGVVPDPPAPAKPYPVRIWYEKFTGDKFKAEALAAKVEAIASKLRTVFLAPLPDEGKDTANDCLGGDSRPDVAIVDIPAPPSAKEKVRAHGKMTALSGSTTSDPGCPPSAGYILLSRSSDLPMEVVLAHELAHLSHRAYKTVDRCADPSREWLSESQAIWAQDLVYPNTVNDEHRYAPFFLKFPGLSLDTYDVSTDDMKGRTMGSYLFPFYNSSRCCGGADQLMGEIWEMMSREDVRSAIDLIVPGGLAETFPAFTLENWNRDSIDEYRKDQMVHGVEDFKGLGGEETIEMEAELPQLAAAYFFRDFWWPRDIRSVAVLNGTKYELTKTSVQMGANYFGGVYRIEKDQPKSTERAHVRVLVNANGIWKPREDADWDRVPAAFYCKSRDNILNKMLIVISNSGFKSEHPEPIVAPDRPMTMLQSNYGCGVWKGSVTYEDRKVTGLLLTWDLTFTPDIAFGPFEGDRATPLIGVKYKVTGKGTWDVNLSNSPLNPTCRAKGNGEVDLGQAVFTTHNFARRDGNLHRAWELNITPAEWNVPAPVYCNDVLISPVSNLAQLELVRGIPNFYGKSTIVKLDGRTIYETFSLGEFAGKWTVDLKLQE